MNDHGTTSGSMSNTGSPAARTSDGVGTVSGNQHAAGTGAARSTGRRQSDRIVSASESTQRSLDQATACARKNSAVLIQGPSGSGRQHFARAIHAWSSRAGQPIVVFRAASTPVGLHGDELFGAAQSDAAAGAIQRAAGGTLLVSGIDQMEPSLRTALITAFQMQSFQRQGNAGEIGVTARLIATAAPLTGTESVGPLGTLTSDTVTLEGLSERREDVLPLAAHFLSEVAETEELKPIGFTSDARRWLVEEAWVGNVRELRERIRQSVRLNRDAVISAESLMLATDGDDVPSFKDAKRAFETRYVESLLRRCGGNISRAARLAKKDRKDFYDVIRRTGVDPSEFRA